MKLQTIVRGRPLILALGVVLAGWGGAGCAKIQAIADLVGLGERIALGDESDDDDDSVARSDDGDDDDDDDADHDRDRKHHDGDDDDGRAATSKRGDDEGRGGEADEAKKDEAKGEAKDEARAPAGDAAGEHAVGGVAVGGGEAGGAVAKSDARRDGGADKADAKAKRSKKTKAEADKAVLASLKTDGAAIDDRDTRSGKSISDETPALATTHGMSVVMPPAAAAAAAPAPAADGAAKPADARPVKVKLSKADIKGALSTDEVTAMKKKLRGGLKSCYRDALDSGASESATATVVVIISESGAVKSVELRGSTLDHTAGEACMKAKLGALTYPAAAGGGSTTVTYSAEFSASADAGATATE